MSKKGLSGISDITVHKGNLAKVPFNTWDFVKKCTGEKCQISHLCDYEHVGKCSIEQAFLTSVLEPYIVILEEEADPILNQWLGYHLIPLYHDLIRILKAKLFYEDVMLTNNRGGISLNPLINEMRVQMKAIRAELRDSGIQDLLHSRGHVISQKSTIADPNDLTPYLHGEKGYYEQMSESKQGTIV